METGDPAPDMGRQNERTTLAWRRTNLAALCVAALAAKATHHPAAAVFVFGAAFASCAFVGIEADRRFRARIGVVDEWRAGRADPASSAAAPLAVATATVLTLALAVFGILVALVG